MLIGLLEHPDFPPDGFALRGVGAGGAEVPEALVLRLTSAFHSDVMVGYGQSECPLITNSLPGDPIELIAATVGMPAPQNDLKIVDIATGNTVPIGESGEICVRSPAMMRGYWAMPEETARTIDAEGWLHTGDLGLMMPTGHIQFKGRARDVVIRGGENIYPMEVEAALCAHPGVAACAVFGVPDERWGQQVGAAIQRAEGYELGGGELETFLGERLAHFKIPRRWTFVAEFPMTASGKVQKFELLKFFLSQPATEKS
jgi:fatty-acyl-CoA synthase